MVGSAKSEVWLPGNFVELFRACKYLHRTYTIYVWYIYQYIYSENQPNVGKYTSHMDGMGYILHAKFLFPVFFFRAKVTIFHFSHPFQFKVSHFFGVENSPPPTVLDEFLRKSAGASRNKKSAEKHSKIG